MSSQIARGLLVVGLLTAGCGHPATVQECEIIVARVAELALTERSVPVSGDAAAEAVASAQRELAPATLDKCVGKRITSRALACIRDAQSYEEIERSCF